MFSSPSLTFYAAASRVFLSITLACSVMLMPQPAQAVEKTDLLIQAVEKNPDNGQARIDLANHYFGKDKLSLAIEEYQAAFRLEPENADFSFQLGNAYMADCQYVEANEQFTQTLRIRPDYARALLMMDQIEMIPGKTMKEKEELCKVLKILKIIRPLQEIQDVLKLQPIPEIPNIPNTIPASYSEITRTTKIRKTISELPKKMPES